MIRKRQKKQRSKAMQIGQPPGTLVNVNNGNREKPLIKYFSYDDNHFLEKELGSDFPFENIEKQKEIQWIDITGINDGKFLQRLGSALGIHPLVLEDIQNTDQRPKVEEYEGYLYTCIRMMHWDEALSCFYTEQVSIVLKNNVVLSFQERSGDTFENIRKRIREKRGRIRSLKCDYLFYVLIDSIVDHYFIILDLIEEQFDKTEDDIFLEKDSNIPSVLYALSKQLSEFRKTVQPVREMLNYINKSELELVTSETRIFFRDIYDHIYRISDIYELIREKISSLLNMHATNLNNKMNIIIKFLTIISTIFIPLTFIAGIYGMNFNYMPELDVPWAYPTVLGCMGLIAVGMVFIFKKKKWF